MRREAVTPLTLAAVAALSVTMMMPAHAAAQAMQPQSGAMQSQPMQSQSASRAETMDMVSARVAVTDGLDAAKSRPGDPISTRLAKKVTLKDGKELPAGTMITGVVARDDMQTTGVSKLALDFNKAQLKDGTVVPIKATIVGVYGPEWVNNDGSPVAPGDQETGTWKGRPTAVDEIGAMPGVDLHSAVTSRNSGVLVSTKKHDVKLKTGTEIALAVAPASSQGM